MPILGSGLIKRGLLYLLRDEFATDAGAGAVTGAAVPGPGNRTTTDTESKLSASGGIMICAGGKTVNAWGNPGINWDATIFPINRVMDFSVRQRSTLTYSGRVGFRGGSNAFADSSFIATGQNTIALGPLNVATSQNTWYQCRIISAAERYYGFIKGGAYTSWRLICVSKKAERANLLSAFTNLDFVGDLDDVKVYDSTGWGEYGAYTAAVLGTGGSWSVTGAADALIEFTWTPKAGETLNIAVRQSDATHRLIIRCDQAGGTIKLIQDNAGESELASTSQTWTANTTYTILIYLNGTTVRALTATIAGNATSYASKINTTSSFNQSATGVNATGATWGKDLIVWGLTYSDNFITPTSLRSTINVMPYGDSKTADGTGYYTDSYPQYLCRAIGAYETPNRIAAGGRTTAAAKAAVDAELASASGTPNYILYNLGANDVTSLPAQATWETNTAYILDAMHTKWANAHIYLARVWRSGYATECDTLAGWQDNVLASRSAWAHVGPDERIYLENGDGGARYTSDGVHPRIQEGYILTAAKWKEALGL